MILVTACSYLHALGMLMSASLEQAHPLRAVGALGTYLGGVIPCIAAFMAG